jgi:hypothetical protein
MAIGGTIPSRIKNNVMCGFVGRTKFTRFLLMVLVKRGMIVQLSAHCAQQLFYTKVVILYDIHRNDFTLKNRTYPSKL